MVDYKNSHTQVLRMLPNNENQILLQQISNTGIGAKVHNPNYSEDQGERWRIQGQLKQLRKTLTLKELGMWLSGRVLA